MKASTTVPASRPGKRMRDFLRCAVWLTLSSLLMRTVSLSFSTYLKEKIGEGGMGLFSLVTSVYTFALTLATSGIGLAASKLVAQALGRGSGKQVRETMKRCLAYSLLAGGTAGVLLFSFAPLIGKYWLQDGRTVLSLRAFALSLPAVSCSSAMSGYFSAMKRVRASAVTRVIEQGMKIGGTVLLLGFLSPGGLEYACLSVVLGGVLAELLSFLLDLAVYLTDLRRIKKEGSAGTRLTRSLLSITLPIALSSYIRSGLVTLEHTLIPRGLRKYGQSYDESLASYGTLSALALPLLFFPASLLYAFTGLLVPEFAERAERGERARITFLTEAMLRYTLCFGIGTAAVFLSFSHEIGMLLYGSAEVGKYLLALSPLIPVMYLDSAIDSMLKGLGKQVYCMAVNIVDAGMSAALVWLLVPKWGVSGYITVIFLSELVNASLSLGKLLSLTAPKPGLMRSLIAPVFAGIGAANLSRLFLYVLTPRMAESWAVPLSMVGCVVCYLGFLFAFGALRAEDVRWIFGVTPQAPRQARQEAPKPAPPSSPSRCRCEPPYEPHPSLP